MIYYFKEKMGKKTPIFHLFSSLRDRESCTILDKVSPSGMIYGQGLPIGWPWNSFQSNYVYLTSAVLIVIFILKLWTNIIKYIFGYSF